MKPESESNYERGITQTFDIIRRQTLPPRQPRGSLVNQFRKDILNKALHNKCLIEWKWSE